MKSRWIATIVCLLYMGVSTVFSAIHHHQDDPLKSSDQCAACAWHHDSQVDVPRVSVESGRPRAVIRQSSPPGISAIQLSYRTHPNRGPPFVSL